MAELQLTHDEYHLLLALPDDGTPIGSVAARSKLRWSKSKYGKAKNGLLDKQLVSRGVGGGGTLRRATVAEDSNIFDSRNGIVTVTPPVAELQLYAPVLETLRGAWSEDRDFEPLAIEDIANLGRRSTGGKWTRPDLVAVGVKEFQLVPDRLFEIITFEVKPASQIDVIAVYEALAHRRSATHSYVLIHVPSTLSDYAERNVAKVLDTAKEHGIGVITFAEADDYETWTQHLEATKVDSSPDQMNAFNENNLSLDGQRDVSSAISRFHDSHKVGSADRRAVEPDTD